MASRNKSKQLIRLVKTYIDKFIHHPQRYKVSCGRSRIELMTKLSTRFKNFLCKYSIRSCLALFWLEKVNSFVIDLLLEKTNVTVTDSLYAAIEREKFTDNCQFAREKAKWCSIFYSFIVYSLVYSLVSLFTEWFKCRSYSCLAHMLLCQLCLCTAAWNSATVRKESLYINSNLAHFFPIVLSGIWLICFDIWTQKKNTQMQTTLNRLWVSIYMPFKNVFKMSVILPLDLPNFFHLWTHFTLSK